MPRKLRSEFSNPVLLFLVFCLTCARSAQLQSGRAALRAAFGVLKAHSVSTVTFFWSLSLCIKCLPCFMLACSQHVCIVCVVDVCVSASHFPCAFPHMSRWSIHRLMVCLFDWVGWWFEWLIICFIGALNNRFVNLVVGCSTYGFDRLHCFAQWYWSGWSLFDRSIGWLTS